MAKRNKIVLIQPKNTLRLNNYPPLNLIKIGSALQYRGYEVKIIPCSILRRSIDLILQECRDALFAGIGVLTPEVPDAIDIATEIKKEYDLPLVWGGWHTTLFPEQMEASNLVDKIIVDEGDELIVELADFYRKNAEKNKNTRKILTNDKKLDLDLLPEPDYSLVPKIEHYIKTSLADKFIEYDNRSIRWLPYEASRGCPSSCAFCINIVTGNQKYRKKSVHKVLVEIESIVRKYNINHLKIIDDNFFVDINWVKEIAGGLIERRLGFTWDAECRVDYFNDRHINKANLELFVKSGLNELNFGVESGSQNSLDIIKKNITPAQSLFAIKTASSFGIVSRCSFIIDVPGETKEDIYKTVRLINEIRKIPKTTCGVHTYRPYPRSELCEELLKKNIIRQPLEFEEWTNKEFIQQFTYADAKRKWQKNYKISTKVSFYQCLESGFWLKPHQIHSRIICVINNIFIKLAYLRNRKTFYLFPFDRTLYVLFKNLYYRLLNREVAG